MTDELDEWSTVRPYVIEAQRCKQARWVEIWRTKTARGAQQHATHWRQWMYRTRIVLDGVVLVTNQPK